MPVGCASSGIFGLCCPTADGSMLPCCDSSVGGEKRMQEEWKSLIYIDHAGMLPLHYTTLYRILWNWSLIASYPLAVALYFWILLHFFIFCLFIMCGLSVYISIINNKYQPLLNIWDVLSLEECTSILMIQSELKLIFLNMISVVDRDVAWNQIKSITGFGPGGSKSNSLFWVASRNLPPTNYNSSVHLVDLKASLKPSCSANSACDAAGATGACCPTEGTGQSPGITLGCCPTLHS